MREAMVGEGEDDDEVGEAGLEEGRNVDVDRR